MTQQLTLHSRLKILIAKTFRAEKLYGSIRNSPAGVSGHLTMLTEISNDIRAREWQKSHFQFRTALNDLLSEATTQTLAASVSRLHRAFQERADESADALQAGTAGLIDAAKRQEYAHVMKISVELIRHRARAQANQVVADELAGVLEISGKQLDGTGAVGREDGVRAVLLDEEYNEAAKDAAASSAEAAASAELADGEERRHSNVIPLARRAAGGNRSHRS
jgi:hypothetical protein